MATQDSTLRAPTPPWVRLAPPYDQVTVKVDAETDRIVFEARGLPNELVQSGAIEPVMLETGGGARGTDSCGDRYRVLARGRYRGRWAVQRCLTDLDRARRFTRRATRDRLQNS